ncbi:MAG TPA: Xaa-Pro dipeptidyl-peptidase [Jiangellaceae bacterium]|nr:Xaa-Pro dipeptidyl-peptidase [Jiangellaceae bacterium]
MSKRTLVRRAGVVCAAGALLATPLTMVPAVAAPQDDPDPAPDAASTEPVFEDGMAQPVFTDSDNWIRQELWVETESDSDDDGQPDRVHVDVTRPAATETDGLSVPVVYETSPYYAGGNPLELWSVDHELGDPPDSPPPYEHNPARETSPQISTRHVDTWVPRGFAVVHSESPGTGYSDGCPSTGARNESLAPKAVVDWLNGRATGYASADGDEVVTAEWSTGKVGMTGTSYNGTLPIAAASTGVEGLEAIIPVAAISEWYEYYRDNGLVRAAGGFQGEDADSLAHYVHTRRDRDVCADEIAQLAVDQDRATGDYSDFWAERSYRADVENIEAATLFAHGLSDWNVKPEQAVVLYEALKEQGTPAQIYLHQDGHGGPPPDDMMNRWFTRYLYDVDNGVEDDPRSWVTREGDDRLDPTPYADYPNPDSASATLGIGEGGTSSGALALLESGDGSEALVDDPQVKAEELAAAESSESRLVYETPALTESVHLSGTPEISVRMAADQEAVNLSVLLFATDDEGQVDVVTRGWADPQNHADLHGKGEPLEPGTFYDVAFDLEPDDTVIPEGSRLGLMLFSSDHDFTIRPAGGAEVDVDLADTELELPVVGGPLAMAEAVDDVGGYAQALLRHHAEAGAMHRSVEAQASTFLQTALRMLDRGQDTQAERSLDRFVSVVEQIDDDAARSALLEVAEALRPD